MTGQPCCFDDLTVTENPKNEWFRFIKLSEFRQLKSFVKIRQNFKEKMAKNEKKWHVKTYTHQCVIKISTIHSKQSLPFSSIKRLCTKKLTIDNLFWISDYAFQHCPKQSTGGKSQESKQLKFAPRLDEFSQWKLALRNLMF